jgi:hypothetical protein
VARCLGLDGLAGSVEVDVEVRRANGSSSRYVRSTGVASRGLTSVTLTVSEYRPD